VQRLRLNYSLYLPPSLLDLRREIRRSNTEEMIEKLREISKRGVDGSVEVLAYVQLMGVGDSPRSAEGALKELSKQRILTPYGGWVAAWAYLDSGLRVKALRAIRQSARSMFPPAVLDYGRFLANGIGLDRQGLAEAEQIFMAAFRLGHRGALLHIGYVWTRRFSNPLKVVVGPLLFICGWVYLSVSNRLQPFAEKSLFRVWKPSLPLWSER
jgi:TPR repeat protein